RGRGYEHHRPQPDQPTASFPNSCLGTPFRETPVSRRRQNSSAVCETEFRGGAFPNRVRERGRHQSTATGGRVSMSITVRNLTKRFGNFVALDDVSLDVPSGTLLALLGPSGSGKTTLLRVIAGLEHPDSGSVLSHDNEVTTQSARDRNVGFVFQHYALFRHMTVFENVAFGLRVRRWKNAEVTARVRELLALVKLEELEGRYPSQPSGGQRQRVALARALAAQPRVL